MLNKIKLGMTREDVISICGEPDKKSVGSKKYKSSAIFVYGNIHCYFLPWKSGTLYQVKENDKLVLGDK